MNVIHEFFSTSWWQDIKLKFFGSLGLTGFGYTADAASLPFTQTQVKFLTDIEVAYKIMLLVSAIITCIMGLTVIAKFVFFAIDRYKNKHNGNSNSNNLSD